MSGLKKFLKGKKKSDKKLDKKTSSTGSLAASHHSSGSSLNLAASTESLGYLLKEKDLPKLLKAAWQGDFGKVKQLSSGKKVNWNETDKEHRTALHLACARGHYEIVDYLVKNNCDLNKNDSEGKTPLMKACEINNLELVDLLLKNGAEANIYDINHMSAMHIAAANGNADMGTYLANRDAKLDCKDMNQVTPLHLCCALGHMNFAEFLISEYVQVNCVDNEKRTPLMTACVGGNMEVVKLLLEHEADPTMTNKAGQTAEQIAMANKNTGIANYIKGFIEKKKTKSPTSPVGSIHSKTSAHELFSATAKTLSAMFSPGLQGKTEEPGSGIFGGPAMNVGATALAEKSEESHSEELGDNSWGDSDTESEFEKKPKGINLSAMIKNNVDNKQRDSPVKKKESVPKIEEAKLETPIPATGAGTFKQHQAGNSDEETESKWDDDEDEEDDIGETENNVSSGFDKNAETKDVVDGKNPVQKGSEEGKGEATRLMVPPPPAIDLDASAASVDFDSSMPDNSFSDLPLSDMDGKTSRKDLLANKLFMEKIKEKKENAEDEDEESVWDESSVDSFAADSPSESEDKNNAQELQRKSEPEQAKALESGKDKANTATEKVKSPSAGLPPKEVLPPNEVPKDRNNNKDNDSEWDSESAMSSDQEPSEEVLPPRTPEQGSEFQISSSGDEDESDFSLEEIINKKVVSPMSASGDQSLLPKTSGAAIFQTEVISPDKANASPAISDSDDDEIEKQLQMNVQETANTKDTSPEKQLPGTIEPPKTNSNRNKQLADLGLDIGSDVSTVSDPEGLGDSIDLPEGFSDDLKLGSKHDIGIAKTYDNNRREKTDVNEEPLKTKTTKYDAMGLVISDDEDDDEDDIETETESEWEMQQKQKRLEKAVSANAALEPSEAALIAHDSLASPLPKGIVQEDEDRLRQSGDTKGNLASDFDNESSSDFSFSQEDVPVPGMSTKDEVFDDGDNGISGANVETNGDGDTSEDEAEAILLKQMEFAEANKNNKPDNSKAKDQQIKARLQSIIDRSKSPEQILEENRDLVKQSLEEKENNLAKLERMRQKEAALQEAEKQRELEFQKRQEELKRIEESKMKQFEQEEFLHKQRLENEEQERLAVLLEAEKNAKDRYEKQEQTRKEQAEVEENRRKELLEKEVEERLNALKREEEIRRRALLKEEDARKKALEEEEDTRRNALFEEEKNRGQELEKIKRELENQEELLRANLKDQENELQSKLKSQEQELQNIEDEKQKQGEALETAIAKLAELEKLTDSAQKSLDSQKEESIKRLQQEEQERLEAIEREAKAKEQELAERLRKLEDEELQLKLRLNDTTQLDNTYEELQMKNQQMKENLEIQERSLKEKMQQQLDQEEQERKRKLSDEYRLLYETLESERVNRLQEVHATTETERQKLLDELAREEEERRRKLSEEGRAFREALEKEREQKLNEIFNTSQDHKEKYLQDLAEEQQRREALLEKQAMEKENSLLEKMKQKEIEHLTELERKTKELELETNEKLCRMEEDKKADLEKKEKELLARLQDELSRKNDNLDSTKEQEYTQRFHELEKEARKREQQLELQLMELRDKQLRNETSFNQHKTKSATVLKPIRAIPIEEEMITSVEQAPVQSALLDSLEDLSPVEEVTTETAPAYLEKLGGKDEDDSPGSSKDSTTRKSVTPGASRRDNSSPKKRIFISPERPRRSAFNPLFSDIEPISSSNHDYTFDHNQSMRFLKGASTPKALTGYSDETAELYEELQEAHRKIDMFREKTNTQERVKREMQSEIEEMHRTVESLGQSHNEKERSRLDVDLELQSLKYKLEQEIESKAVAERLCKQLKDQLSRTEKKLLSEAESRQAVDLSYRKMQSEVKTRDQHIEKLQEALNELQLALETEKDSRALQEQLYQEQLRQHEMILTEAQKTSHHHAQALTKLEVLNETSRKAEATTDLLKMELAKARGELSRSSSQLEEKMMQLERDRESWNDKLQAKTDQLNATEKKLFQIQLQYDNEKANKQTYETHMSMKLDHESNARQQLEAEILSLKSRLESSNREIDRFGEQKASVDKDSTTIQSLEQSLRDEKFQSNKLENKLETAHQKIALLQEECLKVQKELDKTKEQYTTNGREAARKQETLSSTLHDIKDRSQEERTKLLLRNEQNNLLIEKLQNQLEQKEEQLRENATKLKQISQDLQETKTTLSNVEAKKNLYMKERDDVLEENSSLRQNVVEAVKEVENLQTENQTVQQKLRKTKSELQKSAEISKETNHRLAAKSNDIQKLKNANVELNGTLKDIKLQNIQIETDLREEKTKAEVLLYELQNANEARENLETLLNNIKSNNVVLEEKLHSETLNRSQREREAEEHRGLWESEVKSRSKLGLQLMEMDKKIEEMKSQVEEANKKARKMTELKKSGDTKLGLYEQRSVQHQKEVAALRNKLKQYQRKVKSYESGETGVTAMRSEFQKEKEILISTISKLRRQLDNLSSRLSHEQESKDNVERNKRELMEELTDLKTKGKVHVYELEKLDSRNRSLEHELQKQKDFYEKNYIAQNTIEEFKQSLETKCRLDLNKKLQEVNLHLEEQALAREAFEKIKNDKEMKTRIEFENTITDLKSELNQMRTSLHCGLARRDTSQSQAKRYKDLFETERYSNDKLSDKLQKTTDRLNTERSRVNHLTDETINKSNVAKQLFEESPSRNRSASPRFADDLDFNGSSYRPPKMYSTPTATARSLRLYSPEKDLFLSSVKHRNLLS